MNIGRERLSLHFAACAAAVSTACAASAQVVYSGVIDVAIQANIDGLYLNAETGQYLNGAGTGVPGWDINPYGATYINLFAATGTGYMRHPLATTTGKTNIAADTEVGAASFFYGSSSAVIGTLDGQWALDTSGIIGFKFLASDGLTHYGWARIAIGASLATRTLVEYAWEQTPGVSILAGNTGGPPPAYDPCGQFNPTAGVFTNNLPFNSSTAADLATCDGTFYKANFYRFTAMVDGEFAFQTCPADSNVKLAILSACDASATVVACGAATCPSGASATIQATNGTTYYVVIGGVDAATTFGTTVPLEVTPPGLSSCDAAPVAVYGANPFSAISYAPDQLVATSATANTTVYKVTWFKFVPPVTGLYEVDLCGSVNDTKVAIASECPASATTSFLSIAYNDDSCACASGCGVSLFASHLFATNTGLPLTQDLQAGTPYYIVIGGYGVATATVSGTMTIIGPPPPACPGDFNGDGFRDGPDMAVILGGWGTPAGDVNGDGTTDGPDLSEFLSGWGPCP